MPFLVVHGPGSRRGMMLLPAMMGSGGLGGVMVAMLAAAEEASTAGGGGASSAGRHFDSVSSSYAVILLYIGAGVCSQRIRFCMNSVIGVAVYNYTIGDL